MTNPCKDCVSRHAACHDSCNRFSAWQADHKAEMEFTRRMNDPCKVYHRDYEDRHRSRNRKRYMGANGGADR